MEKQSNHTQPLALPRANVVGDKAFAGDLLSRERLAKRLTGYLDRLRVGAVLAIDAPWGEGKTWFGRNWAKHLESSEHSHKVIFIDAFAQDYVDDAFLLIAAEIAALDDGKGAVKELREKTADVMKTILPLTAKVIFNLAGRMALGSTNLSEEMKEVADGVSSEIADGAEKWVENKLEDYAREKQTLDSYKAELAKFAAAQEKPIIIFIDELDRCRPTFAVRLIERIKHFFDVPNLIFVLLLNRKQLESAIKGVYGQETDAVTYLGKFVHLFLSLPKNKSRDTSHWHPTKSFIDDVIRRYGFNASQAKLVSDFKYELLQLAIAVDLSLRDIERACALFVMSNVPSTGLIPYLIVLKVKYPSLYERLTRNETSAHEDAIKMLSSLIVEKNVDAMNWPDIYFKCLQELHHLQLGGALEETPCFVKHSGELGWRGFDRERTFSIAINRIDLPIENI